MNREHERGDKRGDVRRLKPSPSASKDVQLDSSSISRIRWSRRQDHHAHFTTLIRWELEDELTSVEERLRVWSDRRLEDAGIALFKLRGRTAGWLAQWEEMLEDDEQRIARPRQVYLGADKRDYIAISDRS